MSYLEEFGRKIDKEDYQGFLKIWEEYCASDEVDGRELISILELIHSGRFASRFGPLAETVLPLWEKVVDEERSFGVLRLIFDLQTTNSAELADIAYHALEKRYGDQEQFATKIRMAGLRGHPNFQGAIRHYELLSHLDKGRFVYHTGGWGTGEIMELSLVREEIVLEFESLAGRKSLSFDNAFSTLKPLDDGHFLARRFGDPDAFEELARKDPVQVIQMLLHDLGSKTAAEIKDELCELVIPADDWTKWWQAARSRVKRDTKIETPGTVRDPFVLREEEVSHAERLQNLLRKEENPGAILLHIYNFLRDFPEVQRNAESREAIKVQIDALLAKEDLSLPHRLEAYSILEDLYGEETSHSLAGSVGELTNVIWVVNAIEIAAVKKRVLVAVREKRADWAEIFLEALFSVPQAALRDYLFRELNVPPSQEALKMRLEELVDTPMSNPQLYVWFFQKVMGKDGDAPYSHEGGRCLALEGLLTLLYQVEQLQEHRELTKKIYGLLTAKRFQMVRDILKGSSREFAKEFLLLTSKCQTLSDNEIKIMHALVEVVHPTLAKERPRRGGSDDEEELIWTTQAGYDKVQERVRHIGTVEILDVAKEIEKARDYGDLRENAEYKIAQERRARLQGEMRQLSDQLHHARILTTQDVTLDRVDVGNVVELTDSGGKVHRYTILGPWDADVDNHILSFKSRLAEAMKGLKKGDPLEYQDSSYTVTSISSYFDLEPVS
jgi:transcription elongation factor GreA-like protein/transcription elongation GreA/GreB family factor